MKKLLIMILCLLCITGCGSNEKQDIPNNNVKNDTEVKEENLKYITIKLNVSSNCSYNGLAYSRSCEDVKITGFSVENDKENIFKDIDFTGLPYCDEKSFCKDSMRQSNALNKIYEIAIQHNLNYAIDYRYLTVENTYDNIREIVLKPIDEFNNDGVINLNDNILAFVYTDIYAEVDKSCLAYDDEYKSYASYPRGCNFSSKNVHSTINEDTINKLNNLKFHKVEGFKNASFNSKDIQNVIISDIRLYGSPCLYKNTSNNPVDPSLNKYRFSLSYGTIYKEEFAYYEDPSYYSLDRGLYEEQGKASATYKILDEQLCNDYKLTCDRW